MPRPVATQLGSPGESSGVRRAEIVAALALATDLALGQPMEHALRSCVLAVRLAEALGFDDGVRAEVYWFALLHHIGCNAESHSMAALFGDEIDFNRQIGLVDVGSPSDMMPLILSALRRSNAGAPAMSMIAAVTRGMIASRKTAFEAVGGHCEVAQMLGARLGFGPDVIRDLGQAEERWDGKGIPDRLKGEAIAPAVRAANLARDFVVLSAAFGEDAALARLKARRGRAYDPAMVDRFIRRVAEFTSGLSLLNSWNEVLRLEPEPHLAMGEEEFDAACIVLADFADLKSPWTNGHSRGVATLARAAALGCGLPAADCAEAFRAGALHDIGQTAVSTAIWDKPAPLSEREWEEVRLHPYYGERVLYRSSQLKRLGLIVGQHHERLDGSGYYRGVGAAGLSPSARILAAAEACRGMVEDRPHRKALSADHAAATLRAEARAGRFDDGAVAAVLEAAGHVIRGAHRPLLAGLTEREVEVLRLIAGGQTTKEIARALGISPKTAGNHIQNLYPKIEVKTRAGATLYAIEHGLGGSAPD